MKNFILIVIIFFYTFYLFSLNNIQICDNQNKIKINNIKNIFYKVLDKEKYNINKNILIKKNEIFLKGMHKFNPNIFLFHLNINNIKKLNFINIKNNINYFIKSGLFKRIIIIVSWKKQNNMELNFLLKEYSIIKNKYIFINDKILLQNIDSIIPISIKKYIVINHNKIKREINNLRKIYIYFGYALVNINIFIEPFLIKKNILRYVNLNLLYLINTKKKYLLGNINIKGNFFIKKKFNNFYFNKFLFYKYTERFNLYKLNRCFLTLNKIYNNNGYIRSKIYIKKMYLLFKTNLIYINFFIEKEMQYRIYKINFIFNKYIMPRNYFKIFIKLRIDSFFSQLQLSKDIRNIILKYQNNGYLNVNINPILIMNHYNRNISISLNINSKNRFNIKKIIILGNKYTNVNIIKNIIFSQIGYYYKKSILNFIKTRIYKTNYFKKINIIYKKLENEKVNIYIILHEKKINIIHSIYQYNNGISLIDIKINKNNFLKINKKIFFLLKLSKAQRKLEYNIINFYFKKYRIPFKISLNLYNNKYINIRLYKIKIGSIFNLYLPIKYIYKKYMINSYFDKTIFILGYKINRYKIKNNIFEIKSNIYSIYNTSISLQLHIKNNNIYSRNKLLIKLALNIHSSMLGSAYIKYLEHIYIYKYFYFNEKKYINISWNINIKYYKLINKKNTLNKCILKLKTNIFIISNFKNYKGICFLHKYINKCSSIPYIYIKTFNNIELNYLYTKKNTISLFLKFNNIYNNNKIIIDNIAYNRNYSIGLKLKYITLIGDLYFKATMPLDNYIKNKNILFHFYFKSK